MIPKPTRKQLHIVTGPPGGGKTTYAKKRWPDLTVYDTDLGNKQFWRDSKVDCVFMTAAPNSEAKAFWYLTATQFGFDPKIYVVDPGKAIATQRLLKRDLMTPEARPRLSKSVARWYKNYSKWPSEEKITWREPSFSSQEA